MDGAHIPSWGSIISLGYVVHTFTMTALSSCLSIQRFNLLNRDFGSYHVDDLVSNAIARRRRIQSGNLLAKSLPLAPFPVRIILVVGIVCPLDQTEIGCCLKILYQSTGSEYDVARHDAIT